MMTCRFFHRSRNELFHLLVSPCDDAAALLPMHNHASWLACKGEAMRGGAEAAAAAHRWARTVPLCPCL